MAYQSGTYTDPKDLLQKLVTWLLGLGYSQDMSQSDAGGAGWRVHIHRGQLYVNLYASLGRKVYDFSWANPDSNPAWGIALHVGSGFSGSATWWAQPGVPHGYSHTTDYEGLVFMNLGSAPGLGYYFLDDGDHVRVVVERTSGVFVYLMWGPTVEKYGAWVGGNYFLASSPAAAGSATAGYGVSVASNCPTAGSSVSGLPPTFYLRADVDSFTGLWLSNCNRGGMPGSASDWNSLYTGRQVQSPALNTGQPTYGPTPEIPGYPQAVVDRLTSQINGQALLLPLTLYAQRDGGGWSPLGVLPGVCASNATRKGYAPGSTSLIGAETWQHFPNFSVRRGA